MKKKDKRPKQVALPAHSGQTLRRLAEDTTRKKATRSHENPDAPPEDLRQALRELQAYQVELEARNEELQKSEIRLSFETLLANLSARLTNITLDQTDAEIHHALSQIKEFFKVDQCAMLELPAEKGLCRITHAVYSEGVGQVAGELDLAELYPWSYEKLMRGEIVNITRVEDYPEEALEDRQSNETMCIKSRLAIPVTIGGRISKIITIHMIHRHQAWPEEYIPRLRLLGEVLANALERSVNRRQLEEQLEFETLLSEISGHFVNLPVGQIDYEIEDAQRRVCESLCLDLSALWQWSMDLPRIVTMTHLYRPLGGPPLPEPMYAHETFPWCQAELEAGRKIILSSMADVPAEAARDLETWRYIGSKSVLTIPLSQGGGPIFGALSFNAMLKECTWPEPLIKRLELLAQIFTNALIRKQAETALRESEARLGLITDTVGAALWSMDLNTNQVWVSKKSREMFYFAPDEEVCYEKYFRLIHPQDKDRVDQEVQQAIRSGEILRSEYRIVLPDGTIRWIAARGQRVLTPAGKPDRIMGLSLDITDRKLAEEAIQKSEEQIIALVENTNDLIWSVDTKTFGLLTFNRALWNYFYNGHGLEIHRGMTPEEMLPKEYASQWHEFYTRALREGSFVTEYFTSAKTHVLLLSINCMKLHGEVFGISVFGRDITEHQRDREAIKKSEARYRQLHGSMMDGFVVVGMDGFIKDFNDVYSKMTGYMPDELSQLTYQDLTPEKWHDLEQKIVKDQVMARGYSDIYEKEYRRKDGTVFPIELRTILLKDETGANSGMWAIVRDITERKNAENEARQYHQRLKALASQLIIAEERERRSLAIDLHDFFGHSLAVARMELDGISKASSPVEANMMLNDISKILLKTIRDSKDLIFELSSASISEIGLAEAIGEWLEQYLSRRHGIEIEIINHSNRKHLEKDLETIMFRNVRELSTNVIRHADAKKVSVLFEDTAGGIKITITDDGAGFDPETQQVVPESGSGFGLFSIRERMSDLGGSMEIISSPGKGCKVILTAPCA